MILTLKKFDFPREVQAVTSKSIAHRMLICAAFCQRASHFRFRRVGSDIMRTLNCLSALGAKVSDITQSEEGDFSCQLEPIVTPNEKAVLDCGDSGSTLRFMIPIVATLGISATFLREGRLAERPIAPLDAMLGEHGVKIYTDEKGILHSEGKLTGTEFEIAGDVSSQFITGMLFAMALMEEPTQLTITGNIESRPYIELTAGIISNYGVVPQFVDNVIRMPGTNKVKLHRPRCYSAEGDWSGAAAFLCAGAIGPTPICVNGIKVRTLQGDRKIIDILQNFGAKIYKERDDSLSASSGRLHGITVDAQNIPDLIPVVSAVAAAANGVTYIINAGRLRLKESDRLSAIADMLKAVGVMVVEKEDGLEIRGGKRIHGALINAHHDHRIAMAASLLTLLLPLDESIQIQDAEAVSKSWPGYSRDLGIEKPSESF